MTGKSDPYCEITMGAQEHKTKVIPNTLNPKWNASMQFTIRDLHEDVLCITVYDRDLFTPNGRHLCSLCRRGFVCCCCDSFELWMCDCCYNCHCYRLKEPILHLLWWSWWGFSVISPPNLNGSGWNLEFKWGVKMCTHTKNRRIRPMGFT